MSGIYYALSIVALFVIIRWCLANDRVGPSEQTTGLLAMKDKPAEAEEERKSTFDQPNGHWRRDRER